MLKVAIHVNKTQQHQVDYGLAFLEGCPVQAEVVTRPDTDAELHVIIGNWFAFQHNKNKNTIMLDRALWKSDPENVSVSRIVYGKKVYIEGKGSRDAPKRKPEKTGDRKIHLKDYSDSRIIKDVDVREHPSSGRGDNTPLLGQLENYDVAIGGSTSALVTAHLEGLRVTSYDPSHILNTTSDMLQWCDWSIDEIRRGELWLHLEQ